MQKAFAFAVVVLLCAGVESARAENEVRWAAGNPSSQKGTVSAKGSVVTRIGWTAEDVELRFSHKQGGTVYTVSGKVEKGKWGMLSVNNVPNGEYVLLAIVTFSDGMGKSVKRTSSTFYLDVK